MNRDVAESVASYPLQGPMVVLLDEPAALLLGRLAGVVVAFILRARLVVFIEKFSRFPRENHLRGLSDRDPTAFESTTSVIPL
jgi:hypothetical protein